MKGEMVIIPVQGKITRQALDHCPKLEELNAPLGGALIEVVPYFTKYESMDCVAFVDEEGKVKGLPLNKIATTAWALQARIVGEGGMLRDWLVGPIVIVKGDKELLEEL